MASWRDTISAAAQDDLDNLLDYVVPIAHDLLQKRGELIPFAAAISNEGEVRLIMMAPGEGTPENATDIIEQNYRALGTMVDEIRTAITVSDVRIKAMDSDAVMYSTEHKEGVALVCLEPYQITKKGLFGKKTVGFANMQLQPGELVFWPRD